MQVTGFMHGTDLYDPDVTISLNVNFVLFNMHYFNSIIVQVCYNTLYDCIFKILISFQMSF